MCCEDNIFLPHLLLNNGESCDCRHGERGLSN